MRSFRSKPVGWRNDSYRHYLASKGIASSFYAKRTFWHGTDERSVPAIMSEGLVPKMPLWEERARQIDVENIRRNEKELNRLIRESATGRDLSFDNARDIEGYKAQVAKEKADLKRHSEEKVSLTTSPEVAARFSGESRGFSSEGKMLHRDEVPEGKNVLLKVTVDDADVVPVIGNWNLDEVLSFKRIPPETIRVMSEQERQHLRAKDLLKKSGESVDHVEGLPEGMF